MKKIILLTVLILVGLQLFSQESMLKFNEYKPTYVGRNNQAIENLMEARYNQALREAEMNRQRAVAKMENTIRYYNSLSNKPAIIKNGWHRVTAMNSINFCEERLVYVQNNKITKYYAGNESREVVFANNIYQGKGTVRLKYPNGEYGDLLDIYFLESILDPNSNASPPY